MITGLVIPSCLAPSRRLTELDGGFGIDTQPFGLFGLTPNVLGLEVGKDGVGFWDFFEVWL